MKFWTVVPVMFVPDVVVALGNPIGNAAVEPFRTRANIEFLVALTRVFRFNCSLVTLGIILDRPIHESSPEMKLLTVWFSLHSAYGKNLPRACSDGIIDTPTMIKLAKTRRMETTDRIIRVFLEAQLIKHLLILFISFVHLPWSGILFEFLFYFLLVSSIWFFLPFLFCSPYYCLFLAAWRLLLLSSLATE